ncbi:hypothetical protein [Roseimaritima ulvae]|uniref:Uncharacterized protein n=1 Tax=Roseimaritima ulvae TaxID=980254 RepID=A0A5B9QS67_9BACT|nr:hypothetical protein [Roseimaritima ulvae]QEG40215.1 hypothetical protein UC8_22220 [Roseimaritima ulvae]
MYSCFLWLLLPLLIFLGFAALSFVITFREKRYVWELQRQEPAGTGEAVNERARNQPVEAPASPYQLTTPSNVAAPAAQTELPISSYAAIKCRELDALDYQYLGSFRHAKGGIYKIRYDAWISPDRYVLAFVEAGTLASVTLANMTLLTLGQSVGDAGVDAAAGRAGATPMKCLCSISTESAFEASLSGCVRTMLFASAKTTDHIYWHYQRFSSFRPQPFSEDPIGDYYQFRQRDAKRIEELGRLRFIDPQETVWLPTLGGGLRVFFGMYGFMLLRRVYPDRWRLKRAS